MDLHNRYKRLGTILTLSTVIFASTKLVSKYTQSDKKLTQKSSVHRCIVKKSSVKSENNLAQETILTLARGASVEKLLTGFGANKDAALQIANAFNQHVPHRTLKSGLSFNIKFKKTETGIEILSFSAQPSFDKRVLISQKGGEYVSQAQEIKLTPVVHLFEGNVNSSFYSCALKSGVPSKLVQEAVDVLSYVINFQHGIHAGAKFKILCDGLRNEQGQIVKIKQLRYVSLSTGGQDYKLFAFNQDGKIRFFNEKGESVVRSFLQTPLNASKLCVTSGFGMRRHPILGYNRQHKGIDFGAPIGTPVLAAGDGVVLAAGWCGGYGNRVHIKHAGGYETVYAHLKRFGKNIRPGAVVSQRQTIGEVGTTGLSEGPHLHFEVIHCKKHINPMKVQGLPTIKLSGNNMKKFELVKTSAQQEISNKIVKRPAVSL